MSYSLQDRIQQVKTEFQRRVTDAKPFSKNSFMGSILGAFGASMFAMDLEIDERQKNLYADTADLEHLLMINAGRTQYREPRPLTGNIVISGAVNHTILDGTIFVNQDDMEIRTIGDAQIVLTRVESTFTISTIDNQMTIELDNFEDIGNGYIEVVDALEPTLNGLYTDYEIRDKKIIINTGVLGIFNETSTNVSLFTLLAVAPIASVNNTSVTIESREPFEASITDGNIDSVYVGDGGLFGGLEIETLDSFRERVLRDIRIPQAYFTESYIRSAINDKFGVDVLFKNHYPSLNLFTIFPVQRRASFYRVGDDKREEIRQFIIDMSPLNVLPTAIFTPSPDYTELPFSITNLTPNTKNIRDLIKLNIDEYLISLGIEGTATVEGMKSIIYSTVDYTTQEKVSAFNISMSSDVTANTDSVLVWTGVINA